MRYAGDVATAHGFRATARTLIVEMLEYQESVVEMQLDHAVKDANGTAYNRTEFIQKRMEMMAAWASYLDDLKSRIASQTSIAQILYLQGQGGDAMDDAIGIIETAVAAVTAAKPGTHVATPGDAAKPITTSHTNVPAPVAKTTKVIRAADLSSKSYLETEADVDAYVNKLKAELLAAIRAGHIARIQ